MQDNTRENYLNSLPNKYQVRHFLFTVVLLGVQAGHHW